MSPFRHAVARVRGGAAVSQAHTLPLACFKDHRSGDARTASVGTVSMSPRWSGLTIMVLAAAVYAGSGMPSALAKDTPAVPASAVTAPATVQPVPSGRNALATIVANCGVSSNHQPCVTYDPAIDGALLKDRRGSAQFLWLPISSISGMESPELRRPAAPYFADAWRERHRVGTALGKSLADTDVSLAVNPVTARSQDHLHIHIDCVRPDVRDTLAKADVTARWSEWDFKGRSWRIKRVSAASLATENPVALVARELPDTADTMGRQTIFVTGAPSATDKATDANDVFVAVRKVFIPFLGGPSAEDLQDHDCAIATNH